MGTVSVVNLIPQSLSGETAQDSEPNLAVNPQDTRQMVATAFTPPPMGGTNAPIFVSTNGGDTWSLRNVVPGAGGTFPTKDITVAFGTSGGTLYAAILSGADPGRRMRILRSLGFSGTAAMNILFDRTGPDQPWVVAGTSGTADRLWVGNNAIGTGTTRTAAINHTANARTGWPGFDRADIEARDTSGQDGPPVRIAAHRDGTVYAAHIRWAHEAVNNYSFDVVVTRDDNWGTGTNAFRDLVDSRDKVVGTRVADDRYMYWTEELGQERLGGDLALAVDPTDSATVWVAWGYKNAPSATPSWMIDVARSTDSGRNWAPIRRTIVNGKNPALAVNSQGALGFLYQQFTGTEWVTRLEVTDNAWATAAETHVLHRAPSNTPARMFFPYLGDYVRLLSVSRNFYGVFSGSNEPDPAHFPSGVTFQRNADWAARNLLDTNGVSVVSTSIDPFFFKWTTPGIDPTKPVKPIVPIIPRTIYPRGGIIPRRPPIVPPQPPIVPRQPPIVPRQPPPVGPIESPEQPTDLDL